MPPPKPALSAYRLVSVWRLAAPLDAVFDAVQDSLRWPEWWPGAAHVEERRPGAQDGVGSERCYTWQAPLPYRLCFTARATRVVAPALLEADIRGDLAGVGRWQFAAAGGVTTVRHEWEVATTRGWMNRLAPLARPVFIRCHRRLMDQGAAALAERLGATLLSCRHEDRDGTPRGSRRWTAAMLGGLIGGTAATGVQLLLWALTGAPLPQLLMRDTQLAAAVLLGPSSVPPPLRFDLSTLLAAAAVHLFVSIGYGLLQMPLARRIGGRLLWPAGALFGAAVYAIDMYGFTALFPWFRINRDWITLAAHVVYGIGTLWSCRVLQGREE